MSCGGQGERDRAALCRHRCRPALRRPAKHTFAVGVGHPATSDALSLASLWVLKAFPSIKRALPEQSKAAVQELKVSVQFHHWPNLLIKSIKHTLVN